MVVSAVIVGAATVGSQLYASSQQRKQQKKQLALQRQANQDARDRAKEASDRADIEFNKANRKRADVSAITKKEEQAAMAGAGGVPTGPQDFGVTGTGGGNIGVGGVPQPGEDEFAG